MKLELYSNNLSPFAQMVELLLECKGVEFSVILPDRQFVREGGFVEISPLRKVPVLVVDGVAVPETQVIFELVEDLYPTPSLLPADPMLRSQVRLLTRITDVYFAGPSVQLLNNAFVEKSADIEEYVLGMMGRGVRALETWIGTGQFAIGESRSHADCVLPPVFYFIKQCLPALGVSGAPVFGDKTAQYYDTIIKDGNVQKCLSRMEAAVKEKAGK